MKEILLFIIFSLFLDPILNAQKLNFDDLEYIFMHDLESSDSYLTKKLFVFHEFEDISEGNECQSTMWKFNNSMSNSYLNKYCNSIYEGFVWYQFSEKEIYESIKKDVKSRGFNLLKTETNPFGDLCFVFVKKKYRIEFCSGKKTNDETKIVYFVKLFKNPFYVE